MTESLFPLAAYCALMSGTPGPNNVLLATSGANYGYRRTVPHLLGINAGNFGLTVLVGLGFGAFFLRFPEIQQFLRFGGAVYLTYLAWKLAGAPAVQPSGTHRPISFAEGAAAQAVNPKSWMKVITTATVFMPAGAEPLQGAVLVSSVQFAVGFPASSVWALFGVGIGTFLSTLQRRRIFNAVMATALLLLAVSLIAESGGEASN